MAGSTSFSAKRWSRWRARGRAPHLTWTSWPYLSHLYIIRSCGWQSSCASRQATALPGRYPDAARAAVDAPHWCMHLQNPLRHPRPVRSRARAVDHSARSGQAAPTGDAEEGQADARRAALPSAAVHSGTGNLRHLLAQVRPAQRNLLTHRSDLKQRISESALNSALRRMGYEDQRTGHGMRASRACINCRLAARLSFSLSAKSVDMAKLKPEHEDPRMRGEQYTCEASKDWLMRTRPDCCRMVTALHFSNCGFPYPSKRCAIPWHHYWRRPVLFRT